MSRSNVDFFREQYVEHIDELLNYATRHVDECLAEDLVEETFVVAWQKIEALQEHTNPRLWLYRTLKYKCMREMARKSYQLEFPLDDDIPSQLDIHSNSIIEILPKGLSAEDIWLLTRRYQDRLEFSDIAEQLGIKEGAARRRVARAVARCRTLILK